MNAVLETKDLSKSFGAVKVNDKINLKLHSGEIMAILGENGSGKTTLINMLGGIYSPDSGSIYYRDKKVEIHSPRDADRLGIGIVHQHFKLISSMDVTENIEIALTHTEYSSKAALRKKITETAQRYGFNVEPDKKICDMSVSEKQTVEIIKAIIKGASILILDEPTAVLTPQESSSLFKLLRSMKADGKSIIIITHKLHEVLDISDSVYIMRKGRHIDTLETSKTDENELACKMVGKQVSLMIERTRNENNKRVLSVDNISCICDDKTEGLRDISFDVKSGEILGVAGISGCGQRELCECLYGIRRVTSGKIIYHTDKDYDITNKKPGWRRKMRAGIGFVPEDRLGMGLIASADIIDNMMLKNYKDEAGPVLYRKRATDKAKMLIKKLGIADAGIHIPVRMLSGGNVQKVLLGREIEAGCDLLIVSYPVRGLDINSSYMIYKLLDEERKKGKAIIFVGEDLDVLMALSDRIMVMADYTAAGIVDARKTSKDYIGSLMTSTR